MNEILNTLKPEKFWFYFGEVLKTPRPSKKEEKILSYILDFGKKHQLETLQDDTGNILIRKKAVAGMEQVKPVVLQCHVDMVCEKNADTNHDFEKDSIQVFVEDGWLKAKGTTLGADNGVGVAFNLALLDSKDIQHGPIECLFTVDEETGLTGAFGLKPDFLQGKILLNLDSEDDGQFFIGCAGGIDTTIEYPYQKDAVPAGYTPLLVKVKGLKGGHSGDDINKGLGNANKILNGLLWKANQTLDLRLSAFNGGNLRNAIAREAEATVLLAAKDVEAFQSMLHHYLISQQSVYKNTEPHLQITCEATGQPAFVLAKPQQDALLNALLACPHGVIRMSPDIQNFVETSSNLAAIKTLDNHILITTSQRSSIEASKFEVADMVAATFLQIGATVTHGDGYPGWQPNPNSEILHTALQSYKKLFGEDGQALAIHAGLECGLIGEKYPEMDMVSFGPTMRGVHSPDERLKIDTVERFWLLTLDILKNIK